MKHKIKRGFTGCKICVWPQCTICSKLKDTITNTYKMFCLFWCYKICTFTINSFFYTTVMSMILLPQLSTSKLHQLEGRVAPEPGLGRCQLCRAHHWVIRPISLCSIHSAGTGPNTSGPLWCAHRNVSFVATSGRGEEKSAPRMG